MKRMMLSICLMGLCMSVNAWEQPRSNVNVNGVQQQKQTGNGSSVNNDNPSYLTPTYEAQQQQNRLGNID